MIVLRFLHVVSGALWVGMFAFMSFILLPAFAEVGPEGAKLQAALAKRRIPVIMPVIALITLVSGIWLYQRLSGGAIGALLKTPVGLGFGLGGLAALLAFVVGIALAKPFMMRSMKLAEPMKTASPADPCSIVTYMHKLATRVAVVNH